MRYFEAVVEQTVRPWFRKARTKIIKKAYAADDYEAFLALLKADMETYSRSWKLISWRELRSRLAVVPNL